MKNFNKGGRDGGRGGFRSGGDRGGRGGRDNGFKKNYGNNRDDRGEMVLHSAVCSDCGKTCELPFRPTNGKPVFCRDCFSKNKGGNLSDRAPRNNFDRGERSERGDRPRRDFGSDSRAEAPKANDDMVKHLKELNIKIDNLIRIVDAMSLASLPIKAKVEDKKDFVKVEAKVETAKKEVTKKVAAKKSTPDKKDTSGKKSVKVSPKKK